MQITLQYWIKRALTFMTKKNQNHHLRKDSAQWVPHRRRILAHSSEKKVQNINTDTLLIQRPSPKEAIYHVFELSSTEKTIAYYHATAGIPTKETWADTIRSGNYDTWPGLNVKSVNKCFPESYDTQKGHMTRKCQGHIPTKKK